MGCAVRATLLHAEAVKADTLKTRSEKLWERGFDSNGVFAAMIAIAVAALIAEWLLTDRRPVADLAPGDYRQRAMAQIVS